MLLRLVNGVHSDLACRRHVRQFQRHPVGLCYTISRKQCADAQHCGAICAVWMRRRSSEGLVTAIKAPGHDTNAEGYARTLAVQIRHFAALAP